MDSQRGKMTIWSLVATVILVAVAFMGFKYIGTSLEKKQIKKEVFDTLGTTRGGDRTDADIEQVIEDILTRRGLEILELSAHLDAGNVIRYTFSYRIVTNYLVFKKSEVVEVNDQIENYG
jgi:hypothetical protein